MPAALVALGAVGTSVIANYLTLSSFCSDALDAVQRRRRGSAAAEAPGEQATEEGGIAAADDSTGRPRGQYVPLTLALACVPMMVACLGPAVYLPLLRWSGAFPTTILYGLLPPLAALALGREGDDGGWRRAWHV